MASFDPKEDYYAVLQVHPSAHQEVIKRAFRAILKELQGHPDLGGSHEEAVRLNAAYEVLSNPDKRKEYDDARQTLKQRRPIGTRVRPAPPTVAPASASRTVRCPHCGSRNRVPQQASLAKAVCGRCRHSLAAPRNPGLPEGDLPITEGLLARLRTGGEVRVTHASLPPDRRLQCMRCGYLWFELGAFAPPVACPQCHSHRWRDFRLFLCHHCGHKFSTRHLFRWAYWEFPECPSCHRLRWHIGCESHPLRWLYNRMAKAE
jgi:DNA-directed RNA polymerase subunit RPC12/RpoP